MPNTKLMPSKRPGLPAAAGRNKDRAPAKKSKTPKNFCFGCGKDNPQGLGLKFGYDERKKLFHGTFQLATRFTGPPEHAHGGIIATILDEVMAKLNRLRQVRAVTAKMEIKYLRPVPLHKKLEAVSWEVRTRGREHIYAGEIRDLEGKVLAAGRGKFIAIEPGRVFGSPAPNGKVGS